MNKSLILLHGWGYTPSLWSSLRAELTDFTTFAPSLSPAHKCIEDWADAVAAQIPNQSIILGWSLGAMLALQIAQRYSTKAKGLFLIGASPRFVVNSDWSHGLEAKKVTSFQGDFTRHAERTLKRFVALQVLGDVRRLELAPILEENLANADLERSALERGLHMLIESDLRNIVLSAAQPLALLHGRNDALMPVSAAHWLHNRFPHATLEIIEDAGHAPLIAQPRNLAQRIRDFSNVC